MLEEYLLLFYPDSHIQKYIKTPQDMYKNRFLLRQIKFTPTSFRDIVQAVIDAVTDKSKTRTLQHLVVLKRILYSNGVTELEKETIDMLFFLFQYYIFSEGTQIDPEIQRQANNLIRNQLLDATQVAWLIENYERSEHILNRLLRYPVIDRQIVDWVREIYDADELIDRKSELLGLLISDKLPELHRNENINKVLWAIYHSRNSADTKRILILEVVNENNVEVCIDSVYTIAGRINRYDIMEELLQKYC